MKKEDIKVLLVDDHELMLTGLKEVLASIGVHEVETCNNPQKAFDKVKLQNDLKSPYDLVLTDLSFEKYSQMEIGNGEELMKRIKDLGLKVNLGVITGHGETQRVVQILNNHKPSLYLLKDDCHSEELDRALTALINKKAYYSAEVNKKILYKRAVDIRMDYSSVQILNQLDKQCKISNMVGMITNKSGKELSLRSIDNRLAAMREELQAVNNIDLVIKAKELGIID